MVLKSLIKLGADADDLRHAILAVWEKREDRYSEIRSSLQSNYQPVQMHFIGG